MNSLQRTRAAIRGEQVDRLPCFPILIAPACELTGVKQGGYSLDSDVMAETLIRARELTGADGIYVSRDNWVCYEALGGAMTFAEDDESNGVGLLLNSVSEFRKLSVPDPESAPGMRTVLAAARNVVERVGNDVYVQANIDCGPFSLAAILRGAQNFMLDLATEDESEIKAFLEFCTDVVIAYGKAMIKTGVHGIQYGDATASLVGPTHYETFVLPYQKRSFAAFAGRGCDLWLHICGKTDHVLPFVRGLAIQGFEVDALVDLSTARHFLGSGIALKGNLNTTLLLMGSPNDVYTATKDIVRACPHQTGLIVSPGCGVPRMTPLDNLRAMLQACADSRQSGRSLEEIEAYWKKDKSLIKGEKIYV